MNLFQLKNLLLGPSPVKQSIKYIIDPFTQSDL